MLNLVAGHIKLNITCRYISSIIACLVISSCYSPRYMYSPAASNLPVFSKKSDSKIAAYYSNTHFGGRDVTSFYNYGFDLQLAYAPHDHWLVLLNQTNRYEKTSGNAETYQFDSISLRYKRTMTEIGGGYFTALTDSSKLFLQLVAGAGLGKYQLDENGKNAAGHYSRFHRIGVTKVFFQPVLQVHYNRHFSISFASRFVLLWYHTANSDYTATEKDSYLLSGLTASPRFLWEPSLVNNFSFSKLNAVQFELQLGFAALISRRFFDYRSVNLSVGAVWDLTKLKKKKNQ